MLAVLKLILILCVMIVGYSTLSLWKTGRHVWDTPPPPKTVEQIVKDETVKADASQVKFLTAIIRNSYRSNPREMLLVALAAQNTGKLISKDYQFVFRNASEQVPPWGTKTTYFRWAWVVNILADSGEGAAAKALAEQIVSGKFLEPYASLLSGLKPNERCVTTYFRPEGNKQIPTDEDLAYMRGWEPKVYEAPDGAFWLCLPLRKPSGR